MGELSPCAMEMGGLLPYTVGTGELLPCVMGMGELLPCVVGTENFPLVHWNLKKQEEPKRYEVHSLRERYDPLNVESSQLFS